MPKRLNSSIPENKEGKKMGATPGNYNIEKVHEK